MKIITFSKEAITDFLNNHLDKSEVDMSKFAVIRISSSLFLEPLPEEIPEENIETFNFCDIEEDLWEKHKKQLIESEDREEEITGIRPRHSPITDQEATEIVDFVERMREKNVKMLFIHCDAGLCRSRTVATAVAKFILKDKEQEEEFLNDPSTIISKTIMKKIEKAIKENKNENSETQLQNLCKP